MNSDAINFRIRKTSPRPDDSGSCEASKLQRNLHEEPQPFSDREGDVTLNE
jgi:hypothetical protein